MTTWNKGHRGGAYGRPSSFENDEGRKRGFYRITRNRSHQDIRQSGGGIRVASRSFRVQG